MDEISTSLYISVDSEILLHATPEISGEIFGTSTSLSSDSAIMPSACHGLGEHAPEFHMGKVLSSGAQKVFDTISARALGTGRSEQASGYGSASFHDFNMFDQMPAAYGLHNLDHHCILLADGSEHTYFALAMDYHLPVSSSSIHDVEIIVMAPQGQLTLDVEENGQASRNLCVSCDLDNLSDNTSNLLVQMLGDSAFFDVTCVYDKMPELVVHKEVCEGVKWKVMPFSDPFVQSAADISDEMHAKDGIPQMETSLQDIYVATKMNSGSLDWVTPQVTEGIGISCPILEMAPWRRNAFSLGSGGLASACFEFDEKQKIGMSAYNQKCKVFIDTSEAIAVCALASGVDGIGRDGLYWPGGRFYVVIPSSDQSQYQLVILYKSYQMTSQAVEALYGKYSNYGGCRSEFQFARSVKLQGLLATQCECNQHLRQILPWDPGDQINAIELKKFLWFKTDFSANAPMCTSVSNAAKRFVEHQDEPWRSAPSAAPSPPTRSSACHPGPLFLAKFGDDKTNINIVDLSGYVVKRIAGAAGGPSHRLLRTCLNIACLATDWNKCHVLNPASSAVHVLPESPAVEHVNRVNLRDPYTIFTLGRVPSTGEHKVLRMFNRPGFHNGGQQLFEVFTINGGISHARWRGLQSPGLFIDECSGIVIDGVVYFLTNKVYGGARCGIRLDYIVSFDLGREEWRRDLRGPISSNVGYEEVVFYKWHVLALAELKGSLVLADHCRPFTVDLWFLVDFGSGLWVKECNIETESIISKSADEDQPKPLLMLDDGRLVVYVAPTGRLFICDPGTNTFERVDMRRLDSVGVYTGNLLNLEEGERV